jgi:dCTP deaminase
MTLTPNPPARSNGPKSQSGPSDRAFSRVELGGKQGILPCQTIVDLINRRVVKASLDGEIEKSQVQPASLDLRLGNRGFRVRASFLPGRNRSVEQQLKDLSLHEISFDKDVILERGCFYVVELQEILELPTILSAVANPKSSTGRLDVFTRLIADGSEVFDYVEGGYKGKLYAEISPQTFSIKARKNSRLNQLRFLRRTSSQDRYYRPFLTDKELRKLHKEVGLADDEPTIRNGLNVRVDLHGNGKTAVIGYRAKKHAGIVDIDERAACKTAEFWDPIRAGSKGQLILDPDEFYILASKERMQVPPTHAAEMAPIDPMMGEFRAHYAGFFDPGFGHMSKGPHGSKAVLEVRSHGVPFVLEDGQIIARLVYEHLSSLPERIYGQEIGSNYQGQGLKLSKHFK